MVALCAELDTPEESHGGIAPLGVLEHDGVEILHCDPPEQYHWLLLLFCDIYNIMKIVKLIQSVQSSGGNKVFCFLNIISYHIIT